MPTNGFQQLPCVFGINVIDLSLQLEDLFSLDGDISGLTLDTEQNTQSTHQRLFSDIADIITTCTLDIRLMRGVSNSPWHPLKAGEP